MDNPLTSQDVFGGDNLIDKLIEELDSVYPSTTPSPSDDDRSIMYRAGQRSVVEYILSKKHNV